MSKKINGYARWVLVAIALATITYNTVVTHTVVRNDLEHLQRTVVKLEQRIEKIYLFLLEERK